MVHDADLIPAVSRMINSLIPSDHQIYRVAAQPLIITPKDLLTLPEVMCLHDLIWYYTRPSVVSCIILYGSIQDLIWYYTRSYMILYKTLYSIVQDHIWYYTRPYMVSCMTLYGIIQDRLWYHA